MNRVSTWLVKIIDRAFPPEADIFPKQLVEYQGGSSETTTLFPYGMYANVSNDVLALMFFYGGNAENRIAIPGSFEVRPTLEQGEIAIYRPDGDALIKFTNAGDIEISTSKNVTVSCVDAEGTPSGDVTVNCVNADVNASGNVTVDCVNATVTATTAIDLTTTTGDINLTSGGNVNISGGTVTLTATTELELNGGPLVDINGTSITLN